MKTKVKRPKFYNYFEVNMKSDRTCSHDGCEDPAPYISGYYLVVTRQVRVWTCLAHWSGNPRLVLPTPHSIVVALEKEAEHYENMRKRYTINVAPERGVSVKTLAGGGHGDPIPGDRVKQWRWGA